jgi:hypothetical protein
MTARATGRAGGDRPYRRPVSIGRPARRAALVVLLAVALPAAIAGRATASTDPVLPPLTEPGPAIPLPAPDLPGKKADRPAKGAEKAGHKAGGKGGKHRHRAAARGLTLTASCAPFGHTQTYVGWGPAAAYGETVTVVYEAGRCSTPDGSALDVSVEGTAKVFQGETQSGALLDTRPFLVAGTWREPANAEAWPPPWWSCSIAYANYTWQVPGIYTFQVSAREGTWVLDVATQGSTPRTVTWSYDAC